LRICRGQIVGNLGGMRAVKKLILGGRRE
jgi:hypothetical protein